MASIDLPKERNLFFTKQVDQATIGDLTQKIIEINEDDVRIGKLYSIYDIEYTPKPIKIYIDSYGGNVYQCFGLLSVIENSKTPIHTIVTGCAMSCGFMMLISGHRRFAHRLSTPLYHQISKGGWGTIKELEESLEEGKRLQKILEKEVLNKTDITKARLKEVFEQKIDWFMDPEEAKKLGVIDEII